MSFSFQSAPSLAASAPLQPLLPSWAGAFPDGSCGPNLEYDNAFLELNQAALGKPETQFEPATPPDWHVVETAAIALLEKTRDLRVLVWWAQARLHLHGLESLAHSLHCMGSLLQQAWPTLNPPLDEGDPYPRLNAVEALGQGSPFFHSLRHCLVLRHPGIGELRLKDFEALTGNSLANGLSVNRDQVEQFLRSPEGQALGLQQLVRASQAGLESIQGALALHVDVQRLPQFNEVKALLVCVLSCTPPAEMEPPRNGTPPTDWSNHASPQHPSAEASVPVSSIPVASIQSRAQALAAIDQVCIYLEHAEPTNPAQLLLKRARRLIDKNFMQLMKDLAPEALAEVAKIMGVNPDSLEQEDA